MGQSLEEVRDYLDRRFAKESADLATIRLASAQAHLPFIQVPIYVGKFLYLLAKIQNPKKILEIGTLGGYSSAWLAQALGDNGYLISLELNSVHAEVARKNLAAIGMLDRIEIRVGHAVSLLAELVNEQMGPFDFIFIDADKENY